MYSAYGDLVERQAVRTDLEPSANQQYAHFRARRRIIS